MIKIYFRALVLLAILWAAGIYLFLPSTENELTRIGGELLVAGEQKGVLSQVELQFSGQEATLSGVVALDSEKQLAEKIISNNIRAGNLGGERNPVTAVHNEIRVDAAATNRKPQWLIVSFQPGSYTLAGLVQTSGQITKLVETFFPKSPPGSMANTIVATNETALPAPDWEATLSRIPDFKSLLEGKTDKERGLIALCACDGNWSIMTSKATDDEITSKFNDPKISTGEINRSLIRHRVWLAGSSQAELDRLAAEAKAKADAKIKAEVDAKAKAAEVEAKAKADAEAKARLEETARVERDAAAEAEAKARQTPAPGVPASPKNPAKGKSPNRPAKTKSK